jgi:hypothetical protein
MENASMAGIADEDAAPGPASAPLEPSERLHIPHRKRLSHSYAINSDGVRELRIDYGVKEISFDEERLFEFAEQLIQQVSFTGAQATAWGPGYHWDELRPLLEALLDDGIVRRGDGVTEPRGGGLVASPLAPSQCPVARAWSASECESITGDLAGRAVELGYLEAFVPVYRIAHAALDADDRQVGEANVYPPRLRLDRATEWRACQYAGSRYRDELPMNVTALKAMIKHWKPMMAAIIEVRAALRARLGAAADRWTIGELHVLSCVVLALPAFVLQRAAGGSPAPLHPVLSSLFRITDGVRMTTFQMLFSVEATRRADEPLTAAALFERAEQHGLLIGDTGVCAGPTHLIQEFLATIVDGVTPEGIAELALPTELAALFAELPAAIDYGLYALQTWAVSHSAWLAMSRAYDVLRAVCEAVAPTAHDDCARLCARVAKDGRRLDLMQITLDHDREVHHKAYEDGYAQAWRATRARVGPATLSEAIAPRAETRAHVAIAHELHAVLTARFAGGALAAAGPAALDRIVDALVGYLRAEQAILASVTALQHTINALLARPHPGRPLGVRDFLVNYTMGAGVGAFPYLFDTLDSELGVRVECTANAIAVIDRRNATASSPRCYAGNAAGGQ